MYSTRWEINTEVVKEGIIVLDIIEISLQEKPIWQPMEEGMPCVPLLLIKLFLNKQLLLWEKKTPSELFTIFEELEREKVSMELFSISAPFEPDTEIPTAPTEFWVDAWILLR